MLVRDLLQKIEFGSPVAEYDKGLASYFVVTDAFRRLVTGHADIIAGDKGTGKTAIYQHLKKVYPRLPELQGIELIAGFNPVGEPMFRRLGNEEKLSDGQYITIWKMYLLSLVGNWLIKKHRGRITPRLQELETLLSQTGLLSADDAAGTIFSRLMDWLRDNLTPKGVGMQVTFNESGIPLFVPKVELGKAEQVEPADPEMISHHTAFTALDQALAEKGAVVWVVMDRLDEAFVGRPDIEALALRALIRTFMDLGAYSNLHLKLFVRNDLFRKITKGGFVNLTHVSARKKEIVWDDDDLYAMLIQRLRRNEEALRAMGLLRAGDWQLFNSLFPTQVNPGKGQPAAWKWMLSQIRDGNGVKPPRNLIDLCLMAQDEQLRKERHTGREYAPAQPLIDGESLKQAALRLSKLRIEDTLLAEYGEDVKIAIKAFQNGKSDHTEDTLGALFHLADKLQVQLVAKVLMDIGFLEQVGEEYRVPPLYRGGLKITRGKAAGDGQSNQSRKRGRQSRRPGQS